MTKVDNDVSRQNPATPNGVRAGETPDETGARDPAPRRNTRVVNAGGPPLRHGKFGTRREIDDMHRKAQLISRFLKTIGNDVRLLVLCHLIQQKELSAGELMAKIPPTSQSSLSQHLAKMRKIGLITYRRDSQTLHYRIKDPRVIQVLSCLKKVFCDDPDEKNQSPTRDEFLDLMEDDLQSGNDSPKL